MLVTRIRGRSLLLAFIATQAVSLFAISVIWPKWSTAEPSLRFPEAVAGLLAYAALLGWMAWMFVRRGESIRSFFGPLPAAADLRWAAGMGVALVGLAMAGFVLLCLPLSLLFPGFVTWMIDSPPLITWSGQAFHVANVMTLMLLVIAAPLVEEMFFRGCVLPSIAVRRGTGPAVVLSSILFGILHADIVGAFVFAIVMAKVFLDTGSLWLPVVMHASNNAIVWLISAIDLLIVGEQGPQTLADLAGSWWMGAIGLVIGLPVFLVLWKRRPAASPPAATAFSLGDTSVP